MHTGLLVCQIAMQCTYALTAAMQCGTKVTPGTPAGIQGSQKACVLLSCCNPPNKGTEEQDRPMLRMLRMQHATVNDKWSLLSARVLPR